MGLARSWSRELISERTQVISNNASSKVQPLLCRAESSCQIFRSATILRGNRAEVQVGRNGLRGEVKDLFVKSLEALQVCPIADGYGIAEDSLYAVQPGGTEAQVVDRHLRRVVEKGGADEICFSANLLGCFALDDLFVLLCGQAQLPGQVIALPGWNQWCTMLRRRMLGIASLSRCFFGKESLKAPCVAQLLDPSGAVRARPRSLLRTWPQARAWAPWNWLRSLCRGELGLQEGFA